MWDDIKNSQSMRSLCLSEGSHRLEKVEKYKMRIYPKPIFGFKKCFVEVAFPTVVSKI